MVVDHLWSEWRAEYIGELSDITTAPRTEPGSLFERILRSGAPDIETGIVFRGTRCFVILNRFPYSSGHCMVLPYRAVPTLDLLDPDEFAELWALVQTTITATQMAFSCSAHNVGLNLGRAAGGSQSDHLHAHVVPRFVGDVNFLSSTASVKTMAISLEQCWDRLTAVWPDSRHA